MHRQGLRLTYTTMMSLRTWNPSSRLEYSRGFGGIYMHVADFNVSDPYSMCSLSPPWPLAGRKCPLQLPPPVAIRRGRAEDTGSSRSPALGTLPPPGPIKLIRGHAKEGSLRCSTSKNKQVSGAPRAPGSSGKINPPENFELTPTDQLFTQARTPCCHSINRQ